MKTKDITVGEHYAYASGSWQTPVEVEVLATGVETKGHVSTYGRARSQKSGVHVKFVQDGHVGTVASRQIVRPWDEQAEINETRRENERKRFNADRQRAESRATLAYRLEPILRDNGYEPTLQYVSGYNVGHARVALEAAGYVGQAGPYRDTQKNRFSSAVPNLDLLMGKGLVTEDVTALLLDELEARSE